MGQTLTAIAQTLKQSNNKTHLIYAFNGVGKTRLSCAFKDLFLPDQADATGGEEYEEVLCYNAITEDLFYWENGDEPRIKIQDNEFTKRVFINEGKENEVQTHFNRYTNNKTEANYDSEFTEVSFSIPSGDDSSLNNIKISKSEESCYIWCVFYSFLEAILEDIKDSGKNRTTSKYQKYKYIFIDDPVSSLDENHLISLAVDLSKLIKDAPLGIKFYITTHNTLFFNVLCNQLKNAEKYLLRKNRDDNTYYYKTIQNDTPFSYHLHVLLEIQQAIEADHLKKYHFNMLRNVLEKTASFLGNKNWGELLSKENRTLLAQLINSASHSKYSTEEFFHLNEEDKNAISEVFQSIIRQYHFTLQKAKEEEIEP